MKAMWSVLLLAVAGSAVAQSAPPSQMVNPAARNVATQAAQSASHAGTPAVHPAAQRPQPRPAMMETHKPAAKAAAKPATKPPAKPAAKMAAKTPAKPAAKMAAKPATKPAVKPAVSKAKTASRPAVQNAAAKAVAKPAQAPAAVMETPAPESTAGKRDPFISPVVERSGTIGPPCETGKKCIAIGSVVLRGIVKAPEGMIAVVENSRRATYFLHENDPVFNGYVVKITADSIVFRENILDPTGKVSTHDVIKKMPAPAV